MPKTRNTLIKRIEDNDVTLKEVMIYHQHEPCQLLAKLEKNSNVTKLILDSNPNAIADLTIYALAGLIDNNKSIRHLEIQYIHISKENAAIFGESIKKNNTLQKLILIRNFLIVERAACVKLIMNGIKDNKSLTYLKIEGGLGNEGAAALIDALQNNHNLLQIELPGRISQESRKEIAVLLQRNKNHSQKITEVISITTQNNTSEDFLLATENSANKNNHKKRKRFIEENGKEEIARETIISTTTQLESSVRNEIDEEFFDGVETEEIGIRQMSDWEGDALSPDKVYRVINNKKSLTPQEKIDIGKLGEIRAYKYFFNKYQNKYGKEPIKQDKNGVEIGFKISGINKKNQVKEINYLWINAENNTSAPIDAIISTTRNGTKLPHRYIEVKATADKNKSIASISRNQLKIMKKFGDKVTLFRAYDVYDSALNNRIKDQEIKNPYKKILLEPVLAETIQAIKVKI